MMRLSSWLAGLGMVACLWLGGAPVRAADTTLQSQRLQAAPDDLGLLRVTSGALARHLQVHLTATGGYERNPLRVDQDRPWSRTGPALLGQRLSSEMTVSVGLWGWLLPYATVPSVLYQDQGAGVSAAGQADAIHRAALGDARVGTKVRLLKQELHFVDLSVVAQVGLPLGLGISALVMDGFIPRPDLAWRGWGVGYTSEGFPTLTPMLALSRTAGPFFVGGNAGARLRRPYQFHSVTVSDEIFVRSGVGVQAGKLAERWRVFRYLPVEAGVEAEGASMVNLPYLSIPYLTPGASRDVRVVIPPFWQAQQVSMEVNAFAGVDILGFHPFVAVGVGVLPGLGTPDWRTLVGLRAAVDTVKAPPSVPSPVAPLPHDQDGDGVMDELDACPTEHGLSWLHGCPIYPGAPVRDMDEDGINDLLDQCWDQAEDKDGFEDEDGCPDPDNDQDGILDGADTCPNVPETVNTFEDEDGCPDEVPAEEEPAEAPMETPPDDNGPVIIITPDMR